MNISEAKDDLDVMVEDKMSNIRFGERLAISHKTPTQIALFLHRLPAFWPH